MKYFIKPDSDVFGAGPTWRRTYVLIAAASIGWYWAWKYYKTENNYADWNNFKFRRSSDAYSSLGLDPLPVPYYDELHPDPMLSTPQVSVPIQRQQVKTNPTPSSQLRSDKLKQSIE